MPGPSAARARIAYQPALDGIRGIGLCFVLASHAGFDWAKGGFFWVSTFFTLSGYLIATLLLREHDSHGTISLRTFWARRFRRLMPAALLALLGIAVFGATVADGAQLERLRGDALAALLYVANWRFIVTDTSYADLFVEPSPVQHFWTLSIEEQFYLLLPVGLLAGVRAAGGRLRVVAAGLVALMVASVLWSRHLLAADVPIDRMYFGTDTRAPELLGGVLLAVVLHRWTPMPGSGAARAVRAGGAAALGVMLVLTFSVFRTDRWLYDGWLGVYALVSMAAVAGAIQDGSVVRRALSVRPLPWIGRLSYGAYLFHWPLFLWLDEDRTGLEPWPLFAVRSVLALGLAWLSLRFVEQPIREGRRLVGPPLRVVVPTSVAVVVASLLLVTVDPPPPAVDLTGGEQAMPVMPAMQRADATMPALRSTTTLAAGAPSTTPPPTTVLPTAAPTTSAAPAGPVRVLVVGDSQAWVLGNALGRWADGRDDVVVWNQATRGCGIVRGGEARRMGEITQGVCDDWAVRWDATITDFTPDVVVVLSGSWDFIDRKLPTWPAFLSFGDPTFDSHLVAEYEAAAALLGRDGARVLWLTTPCYQLEGFGDDPRHLNDDLLPLVAADTPQVEIVDLFAQVCPDGRFTQQVVGLDGARPDGLHLSDAAADRVAGWLGPQALDAQASSTTTDRRG